MRFTLAILILVGVTSCHALNNNPNRLRGEKKDQNGNDKVEDKVADDGEAQTRKLQVPYNNRYWNTYGPMYPRPNYGYYETYDYTAEEDYAEHYEDETCADESINKFSPTERMEYAKKMAMDLLEEETSDDCVVHATNGDEELYDDTSDFPYIGNFHKGLPTNEYGEVIPEVYKNFKKCIKSGDPDYCNEVLPDGMQRGLLNPIGGMYVVPQGKQPYQTVCDPPPPIGSSEMVCQYIEVAWMSVVRDVAFTDYGTDPLIQKAAIDIQSTKACVNEKRNEYFWRPYSKDRPINVETELFRMDTFEATRGPMVSQFLYQEIYIDGIPVVPKHRTCETGADYLTNFKEWRAVQNGRPNPYHEGDLCDFDTTLRYIRNGRDLGHLVWQDKIYSIFWRASAAIELLPLQPYNEMTKIKGFATHGLAKMLHQLAHVSDSEAHPWYSKWNVHRYPRPEAFGGLVHLKRTGQRNYPLHPTILNSAVLEELFKKNGSYLLPTITKSGSPTHPSYPAGHANSAGACATILKMWFDPDATRCWPGYIVEADRYGLNLKNYTGPGFEGYPIRNEDREDCLTVTGELNKLAHNVAMGRDMSGVHWRTDDVNGIRLGEEVAIAFVQNELDRQPECATRKFLSFDGEFVVLTKKGCQEADDIMR